MRNTLLKKHSYRASPSWMRRNLITVPGVRRGHPHQRTPAPTIPRDEQNASPVSVGPATMEHALSVMILTLFQDIIFLVFFTPLACRCLHLSICPSRLASCCGFVHTERCPFVRPCPHDNSSQICAGITKFAPNMHHGILSVGIEKRSH